MPPKNGFFSRALGHLSYTGEKIFHSIVPDSFNKKMLLAAAERGLPKAAYDLAKLLTKTKGESAANICAWLRKAADGGIPEAQFDFSERLRTGNGCATAPTQAFRYCKMAADSNLQSAVIRLADMYELGEGTSVNSPLAAYFYWKALKLGPSEYAEKKMKSAKRQYHLGLCFASGSDGIPRNPKQALQWYRKALSNGEKNVCFDLGTLLWSEEPPLEDKKSAAVFFIKALESKDTRANIPLKNSEVQATLGECYEHGTGIETNLQAAFAWRLKAAQQGHASAQYNVGLAYEKGLGIPRNWDKADEWYLRAGEQKQPAAIKKTSKGQYRLSVAQYYDDPKQADHSPEQALRWYQMAEALGCTTAACRIGLMFENGEGTKPNDRCAADWFERSEKEDSNPVAILHLAILCHNGRGRPKSLPEARKRLETLEKNVISKVPEIAGRVLFELALVYKEENKLRKASIRFCLANEKHIQEAAPYLKQEAIQEEIGNCFSLGEDVPRSHTSSVTWYRKAAQQGRLSSMFLFAQECRHSKDTKELLEAEVWLLEADKKNYKPAKEWLDGGKFHYENGMRLASDPKQAAYWFEKAANRSHTEAQLWMGDFEEQANTPNKAFRWRRKAADLGNAQAEYLVAKSYEYGTGTETDPEEADRWYIKAGNGGNADAAAEVAHGTFRLRTARRYDTVNTPDYAPEKALIWYQKAEAFGCTKAACRIGLMYENGEGTPTDFKKASEWFLRSETETDNPVASLRLAVLFRTGRGVEKSNSQALLRLSKLEADIPHTDTRFDGQIRFEAACLYGEEGKLRESAIRYYLAFHDGIAEADTKLRQADIQELIADSFRTGADVGASTDKALCWYRKASRQGRGSAMFGFAKTALTDHREAPLREAEAWLTQAAKDGYKPAADWLKGGIFHLTVSKRFKNNPSKAKYWYEKAAQNGNTEAQLRMGSFYEHEAPSDASFAKAILFYTMAADNDSGTAYARLGWFYANGLGTEKDPKRAAECYELSAAKGHPDGKMSLAWALSHGFGCKKNLPRAFALYKDTADVSSAAKKHLARMLRNGIGCKKNSTAARTLYRQLATDCDISSMRALADMLIHGEGGPTDKKTALNLYRKALEKGCPRSAASVFFTLCSLSVYTKETLHIGLQAAHAASVRSGAIRFKDKNGNPDVMLKLAELYFTHRSIGLSPNEATELYLHAVGRGGGRDTEALGLLGYRLWEENPKNNTLAGTVFNLLLTCSRRTPNAKIFFRLGNLSDALFPHLPTRALEFYRKAAVKSQPVACFCYANRLEDGHGAAKNFSKAAEMYTIAADAGIRKACIRLCFMYAVGRGVPCDPVRFRHYAEKALSEESSHNSLMTERQYRCYLARRAQSCSQRLWAKYHRRQLAVIFRRLENSDTPEAKAIALKLGTRAKDIRRALSDRSTREYKTLKRRGYFSGKHLGKRVPDASLLKGTRTS